MIVTGGADCIYNEYGQTIVRIELDDYDLYEATQEYNKRSCGAPPNRTGDEDYDMYLCPECGNELVRLDNYWAQESIKFCKHCGTKIDWDNESDGKVV